MWRKGTITVNGRAYLYCAKVYETGSEFGIGGGRVSKLTIVADDAESWHDPIAHYDRGWDVIPRTSGTIFVLEAVLDLFE